MLLNFIKLAGWQLPWVAIGWMKIFPGWELSRCEIFWWGFSGWEFSWVGVVRVGILRVGVFLGGSFPGGSFLGGSFPGWEFSGGVVFLGGNCPGGTYPGCEFYLVEIFQVGIVQRESSGWEFSCYRYNKNLLVEILNIFLRCSL